MSFCSSKFAPTCFTCLGRVSQTLSVSLGYDPFCISAWVLAFEDRLAFFLTCVYCNTSCSICQPSAFNNPTTHRTIATPLMIICGLFITRYDHVKKHRAPTSATALRKLSYPGQKLLITYIPKMNAVPVHCIASFVLFMCVL